MMRIATYVASSCAVSSIADVGSHKNPVDALTSFCKQELGVIDNRYVKAYQKATTFYVFCAGPEVKSDEKGGSHHSKNHWPRYGTELAAYIVENNLGEVVSLGPKLNLRHHKESTAQAWLWSPDQDKLEKWWQMQQLAAPKLKKGIAPTPAAPIVDIVPEYDPDEGYDPDDDPDYYDPDDEDDDERWDDDDDD